MRYIIVQVSNQNDILEADVLPSVNGVKPLAAGYHLMLGEATGGDDRLTVSEALRLVGWAVADQLKIDEPLIRSQAEGARAMILGLPDDGEVVVRFDLAVGKSAAVDALIDGGVQRSRQG